MKMREKLQESLFELLPHPANSPDLLPATFLYSQILNGWMLAGRKFCSDKYVIVEAEAYFEDNNKSYTIFYFLSNFPLHLLVQMATILVHII